MTPPGPRAESPQARFWRKVTKTDTCWLWTGAVKNTGYGVFNTGLSGPGRSVMAHRYAWERINGRIPDGLVMDHLCGVPLCVNPDHLEPCTIQENSRRGRRQPSPPGNLIGTLF